MLIGDHWAVELEGFTKSYRSGWLRRPFTAVEGLTLKLAPGQVLGLLGPNGSGKSTTLKALAGLVRPTAGTCRILGHLAGSPEARACIGYLPDAMAPTTRQTGAEFLRYCAGLSAMRPATAAARVKAVLGWTGLGEAANRPLDTLSKGMRQRLGLAQAVLHEPPVLLLDEPMSGLDPEGRLAVARLIRDLTGQGRTVVFTAPLLAQAEAVCDRLALLGAGRLLAQGSTAELLGGFAAEPAPLSRLEQIYLEKLHGRP